MKKVTGFLKMVLAGILAVAILCLIFTPYTFTLIHKSNKGGNTDYIWPANARWFKMTEGISTGKFDSNGFNNLEAIDNPDILILGSSHMEATDVPQGDNLTAVINDIFDGQYRAYSMGISGHTLTKVVNYLPVSMELFENDPKYVVIEISNPVVKQSAVDNIRNGTVSVDPSYDTGIIATLQKFPFIRLVYQQISGGLLKLFMPSRTPSTPKAQAPDPISEEAYDGMLTCIREAMGDSESRVIIMYHATEILQEDGSVTFDENKEAVTMFSQKCEEYGFTFLNMTEAFTEMYENEHKLPHGFITGAIGTGHLNTDGHRVMAETLAEVINRLDQEDELCK